ncbi:MAG: hypothetical protein U0414_42260 [Polyangiaceae bacterium]
MIQVEFLTVATARCCRGTIASRYRVQARVLTTATDIPHTVGPGMEFDPASGVVTLHDWIYEDDASISLWSGFPITLEIAVTNLDTAETTTARERVVTPQQRDIVLLTASVAVTAEMRVPVRGRNGSYTDGHGRYNFGHQNPEHVFLFRGVPPNATIEDGGEYQTVAMQWRRIRAEIYPVWPHNLNAVQRPSWAIADGGQDAPDADENASTALNMVANPSVIPRIANPTPDTATELKITTYFPRGLGFTATDPRLRWRASSIADGAEITFVPNGGNTDAGTSVRVAGVRDGEVRVELLFNTFVIGVYRALVRPIVRIPYRVVLMHAPSVTNLPSASMLEDDMRRVNRILRQVAVELVPDTSAPGRPNITATSSPGIFIAQVSAADTVAVSEATGSRAAQYDARPNVVNFGVVHSNARGEHWLAFADQQPPTAGSSPVVDTGVPGSSWIGSTGIEPLNAPSRTEMPLLGPRNSSRSDPRVTLVISAGSFRPDAFIYRAGTIAHELCHGLNLNHRAVRDPFPDGLTEPGPAALMHPVGLPGSAYIDIVEARGIWMSHFVTHYLANPLP